MIQSMVIFFSMCRELTDSEGVKILLVNIDSAEIHFTPTANVPSERFYQVICFAFRGSQATTHKYCHVT